MKKISAALVSEQTSGRVHSAIIGTGWNRIAAKALLLEGTIPSRNVVIPQCFPSASRSRTILVVEDEALVRMVMADDLRAAGYVVIECATGDEAWELLMSGVEVDLLFSDVQMPGSLDGLALAHAVREQFPRMPILIASARLPPSAAADFDAFLQKPFSSSHATRRIDSLLRETANDRRGREPK